MSGQDGKEESGVKSPADTRLHILSVASDLMTEKGIKETSLKDIAKRAGISQGTLYYYYSAKEDIIYDIAVSNLQHITEGLLAWIDEDTSAVPPDQILKAVFEKILAAETRGRLHLYLLSSAGATDNALAEKFRKRYDEWRSTMEQGLNSIITDRRWNSGALSYLILAALDGLMIQKMFGADDIPVKEIVDLIMRISH